jgi:hypothetical protein
MLPSCVQLRSAAAKPVSGVRTHAYTIADSHADGLRLNAELLNQTTPLQPTSAYALTDRNNSFFFARSFRYFSLLLFMKSPVGSSCVT